MTDAKLLTALRGVLTDTYALAVKTHAAHWGVEGAGFFELHAAFGTQYAALLAAADELAERLRALRSAAPVGILDLAKQTTLKDIGATDGPSLARSLLADHRALSAACAAAVKTAQGAGDEGTADLLIGRGQEHDKTAWMLEAFVAAR